MLPASARVGLVSAAFFAAAAVSSAWLPVFFADRGLTPAEIGTVLGCTALVRVAGVPGGGWLADVLGRRRVLVAACGVAAAAAVGLHAVQGIVALLLVMAALGLSGALLAPLTDAITLALAAAGRLEYGRARAWGSISYMLATAGAGALLARTGTGVVPGLLAAGYAAAAVGAVLLPEVGGRAPPRGVAEPFRSAAFRWTLVATVLVQGSHAAYYGFAAVHWRAAGIGDATIGLLIAEGIVAEVALFLWGRGLVERLGPARLTAIAAGACLVRWTVTALTVEVAVLAVVQVLHSVTFAFQHLSTQMVLRGMPGARAAMAQTLVSALGSALATAVLSWVTGHLYGSLGGLVYLPMALVGGAALLVARPLGRAAAMRG